MSGTHVLATMLFACLVTAPVSAQSVGVFRSASGARAASLAGAGTALGETPIEALASNPAGLGAVEASEIATSLAAASANGSFANRVDPRGTLQAARGLIPEGVVAWRVRRSPVVLAGGFIADGAIGGDWQYRDAPGVAGVTYGMQTHRSAIRVGRISMGAAAQVSRTWAVGGALFALRNDNELVSPYVFQSQAPLVGLKTLLAVETGGWGVGANVGVTAKPSPQLSFGASYRTATSLRTRGTARGDVTGQLGALGIASSGAFTYAAEVANRFPQQVSVAGRVQVRPRLHVVAETNWLDWSGAFADLPITLRDGNNAVINTVVGGSLIEERVPLQWRDQLVRRAGLEYAWREAVTLRGGYAYGGQVVPTETLTPMTAAIIQHTFGVGAGLRLPYGLIDIAMQMSPRSHREVARTTLAGSGEYDATRTGVGMRALSITWTRRFGK